MASPFVSFSAADQFHTCERRYYFDRVAKIPLSPADQAKFLPGQMYHAALAGWARGYSETGVEAFLRTEMQKNMAELLACFGPEGVDKLRDEILTRLFGNDGILMGGSFLSCLRPTRTAGIPNVELEFKDPVIGFLGVIDLEAAMAPGVDEKGRIVRWEEGPCVVDWKMVGGSHRRSARDAAYSPQLALYALTRGVTKAAFIEIPRDPDKNVVVRSVSYTSEELTKWRTWLLNVAKSMQLRHRQWKETAEIDTWKQCLRANPLCCPMWCSHFFRCYPSES